MRRKNRKWLATAVGLYLLVMWFAYHWGVDLSTSGGLFDRIDREAKQRQLELHAQEKEAEKEAVSLEQAREARFSAGPTYVAARYDATHVVFMVTAETESRFASSPHFYATATKISAPEKLAAPLAGLQELWEPDSQQLHFFPKIVQKTQPGEQWTLGLSADSTIPVVIDRAVIAPTGCSLALGFLASVPADQQTAFAASSQEYFSIRHTSVEPVDPPVDAHISELRDWKPSRAAKQKIEEQLAERMKREVEKIDAQVKINADSPGAEALDIKAGSMRPRLKEWLRADRGLLRGEGALDYDIHALRLTPDGVPRLLVRARWMLAGSPVFLMTAWFQNSATNGVAVREASSQQLPQKATLKTASAVESPQFERGPELLWSDASWSTILRGTEPIGPLGDSLNFQSVLNEFDADHDGWAELLIHSDQGSSTAITLYLYTDLGLVPLKTPFRRDSQPPESCIDP